MEVARLCPRDQPGHRPALRPAIRAAQDGLDPQSTVRLRRLYLAQWEQPPDFLGARLQVLHRRVPARRELYLRLQSALGPHARSEEHTSELQSHVNLVCRLLLEKK